MNRHLLPVGALAALALLTACASRCPHLTKLMPLVGEHRFEGTRVTGREIEIGGTMGVSLTPDRDAIRMHYRQVRTMEDEGVGEIRWDPERTGYVLTWDAASWRGAPLTATGFVHADGRLVFEGDIPSPSATGEPARFIYTFTFPERGTFILTVRHPGAKPNQVFESFRITAERTGSEPSRAAFSKRWAERRDHLRAQP
jgi:hypothetical protein